MVKLIQSIATVASALMAVTCSVGCDTVVAVDALDSLDGVELVYEQHGDVVIPRRADGEPLIMVQSGPRAQTLYLNFDGATITKGDWAQNNAQTNTSFVPTQSSVQVPAFDHSPWGADRGQVIAAIVDGVRQDFADYQVTVTTTRPQSGDYTMVMMGGSPGNIGQQGGIGLAPLDNGNWNPSDIGFVFTSEMAGYGYDTRHVAWVTSHEFGHSFGLDHIQPNDDIMHPTAYHHGLRWGEGNLSSGGGYQRDHDVIGSVFMARAGSPQPQPPAGCGQLGSGQTLSTGQAIQSCDGRFSLAMQSDGNLVLYQQGSPLWHTATYGTDANRAVMQSDGNLVVYGPSGAKWHSATYNNPGAFLAVQTDGNAVVYSSAGSPLWASNTCCR